MPAIPTILQRLAYLNSKQMITKNRKNKRQKDIPRKADVVNDSQNVLQAWNEDSH